jgi:hypothetical protein
MLNWCVENLVKGVSRDFHIVSQVHGCFKSRSRSQLCQQGIALCYTTHTPLTLKQMNIALSLKEQVNTILIFFSVFLGIYQFFCASAIPWGPARGTVTTVPSHETTNIGLMSSPRALELSDSNPGLLHCDRVRYHWDTFLPQHKLVLRSIGLHSVTAPRA